MLRKEYLVQRKKLILGLVVLIFILLGLSYRNKKQLNYLTQRIDSKEELNQELSNKKEELLFWQQRSQKRDKYKKDFNKFADEIDYDKLLADLNSLLEPNLKLKELVIANGEIVLTGEALTEAAITDSLSQLKSNDAYSNFKIRNLNIKEEISFVLEGELKQVDET